MTAIRKYTAGELYAFTQTDEYRKLQHIPMSPHRAYSFLQNPRCEERDTVMFVVFENDDVVAYLGTMPDLIYVNEKPLKVAWLSTLWVSETQRGRGVAKKLLLEANETWDGNLTVTDISPEAKSLYYKLGIFFDYPEKDGLRCFFRFNLYRVLLAKDKMPAFLVPFVKALDLAGNALLFPLKRVLNAYARKPEFDYITEVNEEIAAFIRRYQEHNLSRRGTEELNWVIRNPWVLEGSGDGLTSKYDFSYAAKEFKVLNITVYENRVLVGYIMITLKNGVMKLPYFVCDERHFSRLFDIVYYHMLRMDPYRLDVYIEPLVNYLLKDKRFFIYRKRINRGKMFSKKFTPYMDIFRHSFFFDGDADCAFT